MWHVSRQDSFRHCSEYLLETSLEVELPSQSRPRVNIQSDAPTGPSSEGVSAWVKWPRIPPPTVPWPHLKLAFPPPRVILWPLSFCRKETPLAHFGISFVWVSTDRSFSQAFPSVPPTKTSGSRGTWRGSILGPRKGAWDHGYLAPSQSSPPLPHPNTWDQRCGHSVCWTWDPVWSVPISTPDTVGHWPATRLSKSLSADKGCHKKNIVQSHESRFLLGVRITPVTFLFTRWKLEAASREEQL